MRFIQKGHCIEDTEEPRNLMSLKQIIDTLNYLYQENLQLKLEKEQGL